MLAPGTRAPEIRATELDGTQVAVSDLLARGPVLAAFFKVSCPTCQYTFPFLQRMADRKGLDNNRYFAGRGRANSRIL